MHFRVVVDIGMIGTNDWFVHIICNHAGVCRTKGPSWENYDGWVGVTDTDNNRQSCWVITILANFYTTRIMFDAAGMMDVFEKYYCGTCGDEGLIDYLCTEKVFKIHLIWEWEIKRAILFLLGKWRTSALVFLVSIGVVGKALGRSVSEQILIQHVPDWE